VGVTFRGVRRRINEHMSRAVRGGKVHRDCWIRSLILAGLRPIITTIEHGLGDGWQEREMFWIASHPTGALTNHTMGGEGTHGYVPTPELRAKWSAMRRGVPYRLGRRSAMLGQRHSAEALKVIRAASMGRNHTSETKAAIGTGHRGKSLSAAHREKLAARKRGHQHTPEHNAKITAAVTNRKPVECIETGRTFASVTAAARELAVNEASVYQAIRKGCRCKGSHYRLV